MAMLHTLLNPVVPFPTETATDNSLDRSLSHQMSTDWQVLEDDGTAISNDVLEAEYGEQDYLAVLEQFPFSEMLAFVFRTRGNGWRGSGQHSGDTMLQLLAFTSAFLRTLSCVFVDPKKSLFRHFLLHVIHHISKVCTALSLHSSHGDSA